jgi:ParB family chromosome partitioning protein
VPGLGRGLSDIIAQGVRRAAPSAAPLPANVPAGATVREIPLADIRPNANQPRMRFIEEPLDELVASIQEHGILQPITVRPKDGHFEIIAGERRFRACQKAGLSAIPAIIKPVSDAEALELALIENLQREDLDPIEEAKGYRQLADAFSLTQEQIARKIGKNRATIANAVRLLELPDEIQGYLSQGRLSPGHAKAILGVADVAMQTHLARQVIRRGLNVRQAEHMATQQKPSKKSGASKSKAATLTADLQALQEAIQQKLGTRVTLHTAGNGGRIEVHYYTASDLDRLLEILHIQL